MWYHRGMSTQEHHLSSRRRRVLAFEYRVRADAYERLAASFRHEGDSAQADEFDQVAVDYLAAAERLELGQ